MEEKFTHKVDPKSIHADQRKRDTSRDAWDRDYMPADWVKPEPTTTRKISNAAPVFAFAFFYICIIIMIGSIK